MRTGIVVLGRDSRSPGCRELCDRMVRGLRGLGYRSVQAGYHRGEPFVREVILSMYREGVDSFAVIPMLASEGRLSTWIMPGEVGIPDCCGSWMIIDGHDVAVRFSTVPGVDPGLMGDVVASLGNDTRRGILVLYRGSSLRMAEENAGRYAERIREMGFGVSIASVADGAGPAMAQMSSLRDSGCGRITILPLTMALEGRIGETVRALCDAEECVDVLPPLSSHPSFMDAVVRRVPDEWDRERSEERKGPVRGRFVQDGMPTS